MTSTHPVAAGLERLGDAPALFHGRTVLTGTDLLRAGGVGGAAFEALDRRLAVVLAPGGAAGGAAETPAADPDDLVHRLRGAYGEEAHRVAVFGDYVHASGDAVLAAWAAGAAVVCGHDSLHPARALALLERTGADRAFAPADLLSALPEDPSAPLVDLSRLATVVYCDGPLPQARTAALRDGTGVSVVHVAPGPGSAAGEPGGEPVDPAGAARAAADRALAGVDLHEAVAAVDLVSRASLLSMVVALRRLGLFTNASGHTGDEVLGGGRIAERHHGLVLRWLAVLTAEGLLRRHGDRFHLASPDEEYTGRAPDHAWDEAEKAWRATTGSVDTVAYARHSAGLLPDLLTGGTDAVSLLFPRGSTALAESLYREGVTARYQHHAVGGLLGAIADRWPRHRPLRVLEVGAGTGATTERALPALTARGADLGYLFTDVTPFFLERARRRWGAEPGVEFGLLDIDLPTREQGFAPGSFDIVVAGGVLNAARDTDTSLRSLAGLLAPGGWLVLTEPTAEEHWVMITQAFLLTDARDARTRTGATFLSLSQWREALDSAGLPRVVDLPEPGHPLDRLGHRVFAARRSPD
ncbi:methyltransferase [Streptomyces alkaliphilus]|uniref:Methyltransferase n=1 Tax=Streptomyces alkaliphilus TaxID=1472722 RepID=A0A7W3XZR9_9ACTN|nr:class I SAM-dependent methyltransferase [Streptomyces alkaliphilus]MBB0242577.1 methyltransferase [Streptomyces alkaliphilus]